MRVYISGPIKDNEDFRDDFIELEALARDLFPGSSIYNPVTLGEGLEVMLGRVPTYGEYMKLDIEYLVKCDAILMMQGWETSSGARCEHLVAIMCDIRVDYQ